ncbi:hypothetical protein [Altererythrobacter sp. Z27]|uniref:hypothetical protein n=1 Tax=Altererythrobacter sp. Z27 TaxID=3461147 RepID=UPI0040441FD1
MAGRCSLALIASAMALAFAAPPGAAAQQVGSAKALQIFSERQALEGRLQDIGWKLATANAPFCDKAIPAVGLQLHDMASYGDPAAMRLLLGLTHDFALLTVASDSPAAAAGLAPGSEIAAIDEVEPNHWETSGSRDWRRTVRAHDLIDARLVENGSVTVTPIGGAPVTLAPVMACASRFELGGSGKRAVAEGTRVIIDRDFPGFDYAEDELAAAIAHELAHNLLRHRAWLDGEGRRQGNIRLTEREADRMMPWLLANAGYDPGAAMRFMQLWGPRHSGGILRKRSHDGWDERAEAIEAETALVRQLWRGEGIADWRAHFRREIAPAS